MVKKVWNEKLLLENKIYKIIDEKKLEQNMDFQVSIDSNVKSIKIMPEKIKTIQKGKLKKKIFVSTLNHNIYPIIVYNPLAFRFLALNQIWILLRKHPYPRPSEAYQVLLQEQLMSFSLLIAYTR